MSGERAVAEFVAGVTWDDLPTEVQRTARLALMDTLGATLAGIPARVSRITARLAHRVWPGEEATVLTTGRKASAVGAAFANGYAANAVDIDDCAIYTKGHPGVQIFPTALALSEARGARASGAEMLTAMVVGYEVAHRAARIWHTTREVYQACGSWGLALEGDPRGWFASRVVVRLRDGRTLDSGIVEGDINYPQRCWDEESAVSSVLTTETQRARSFAECFGPFLAFLCVLRAFVVFICRKCVTPVMEGQNADHSQRKVRMGRRFTQKDADSSRLTPVGRSRSIRGPAAPPL